MNDLMTAAQAAQALGMSRGSLHYLRTEGKLTPVPVKTALKQPRVQYRRDDVERFLREAQESQAAHQAS